MVALATYQEDLLNDGSLLRLGDRSDRQSKNETGQTFVEYALVLSVIVVGVLLAATWGGLTPPSRARSPTVTAR